MLLVAAIAVRLGLVAAGWGYYYKLGFRHNPTPAVLWHALGTFASESVRDLGPRAWGWGIGFAAWIGLALADFRRKTAADPRGLALHLFIGASVVAMIAVLIFVGYWKSWVNVRYLLNVLLLPLALVAIATARSPAAARASAAPLGRWRPRASRSSARPPALPPTPIRPVGISNPRSARAITRNLSPPTTCTVDWPATGRPTCSMSSAPCPTALPPCRMTPPACPSRLNALLPDGHPYFWCNNAFWYFDPPSPDGTLRWPKYDFILTNDLDRPALLERFGPPAEIVKEGEWEALIYGTVGQARIKSALAPEVIQQLGPRLEGLHMRPSRA